MLFYGLQVRLFMRLCRKIYDKSVPVPVRSLLSIFTIKFFILENYFSDMEEEDKITDCFSGQNIYVKYLSYLYTHRGTYNQNMNTGGRSRWPESI